MFPTMGYNFLIISSLTLLLILNKSIAKYSRRPIEKRAWTDTSGLSSTGSGRLELKYRFPFRYMELTYRDFFLNCDGQCFYHLGDYKQPSISACDPFMKKDCGIAISIARHSSNHCAFVGQATGTYNYTLCTDDDQFYSISLIRRNLIPSCAKKFDFVQKMACIPREYIAISFYEGPTTFGVINETDKWYVCIAGEQNVQYWESSSNQANRPVKTSPYKNVAPGVIGTPHLDLDEVGRSFHCQFIISAKFQRINIEDEKADSFKILQFPRGNTIIDPLKRMKIRIVQGRIKRTYLTDIPNYLSDHIEEALNAEPNTPDKPGKVLTYLRNQQAIEYPKFNDNSSYPDYEADAEFLFADTFIGVDTSNPANILFEKLNVSTVDVIGTPKANDDNGTKKEFEDIMRRCDDKYVKCFAPNNQRNCIYREKCPVMIMVEPVDLKDKDRKQLHFRLFSFTSPDRNFKRVVRPSGWAAVGFSNDQLMGDDLVIACQFSSTIDDVVVAWNRHHANNLDMNINQGLIYDKKPLKYTRDKESDNIMCEWKMNSKFDVDLTTYIGVPLKKASFDLMQRTKHGKTFILIASGGRVYEDRRMTYHKFRQALDEGLNAASLGKGIRFKMDLSNVLFFSFVHGIYFVTIKFWFIEN